MVCYHRNILTAWKGLKILEVFGLEQTVCFVKPCHNVSSWTGTGIPVAEANHELEHILKSLHREHSCENIIMVQRLTLNLSDKEF